MSWTGLDDGVAKILPETESRDYNEAAQFGNYKDISAILLPGEIPKWRIRKRHPTTTGGTD